MGNLLLHSNAVWPQKRERDEADETVFELHVASSDMGKVIGRHGKIAKEIRVLMRSVAQKQ